MNYNRILLIASSSNAGLTFYYTRLAIAFKRNGIDVVVVSDEREQYSCLSNELESWNVKQYKDASLHKVNLISLFEGTKFIRSIIKEEGYFDFILGGGVREGIKFWMSTRMLNNKPITISVVGSLPRNRIERSIAGASYSMFYDKCVALCNFTKKQLTKLGISPHKIIVAPLFAPDLEWFDKTKQSKVNLEIYNLQDIRHPVVFYAAGHYSHKGFKYYLMAAAEVLKRFEATFIVGGRGPLTRSLKKLSDKIGISKNVIFTGWISNYHMPYILGSIADICVSTSLVEQIPSYVMECMAAEKPVVASGVGGVPEIIVNRVNGYLVAPHNYKEVAKCIINLLTDPRIAKEMGLAGRRIITERFNMKKSVLNLMKNVLD
ncbi:MAG: glycosyltransferase family 4 protein [Candidatus Odinarchaeia archaeon]